VSDFLLLREEITQKVVDVSDRDPMTVEMSPSMDKKSILKVTEPTPVSNNIKLATLANSKQKKKLPFGNPFWT